MAKTTRPGRIGRPPAGPHGEKTSTYPPLTVRLPVDTRNTLKALAALRKRPAWAVVNDALVAAFAALPADERKLLAAFARRAQ